MVRRLDALSKDRRFDRALGAVVTELKSAAVATKDPSERKALARLAQRFGVEGDPTLEREVSASVTPSVASSPVPVSHETSLGHVQMDSRAAAATRAYRQTTELATEQSMSGVFSRLCDAVDAVTV